MTPLDWTHAIADLPSVRTVTRDASAAELAALTQALGVLGCQSLTVAYKIRPLSRGRYNATGECRASVSQACIVTLEPVASALVLPIDVEFSSDAGVAATGAGTGEAEVLSLPEIEPIENGILDIGRVVFEVLAAGLDPYPRKAGATFAWDDPKAKDNKENPFNALAKLKPKA